MQGAIQALSERISNVRIAVIGDVMVDENIEGPVPRISPEAPVVLLSKQSRRVLLGGAANVAAGIATLGAHCMLVGLVGKDAAADELHAEISHHYPKLLNDSLVTDVSRPTTVKTRFWGTGHGPKHLLLRVDHESVAHPADSVKEKFIDTIRRINIQRGNDGYGIIVLSDYAKGVMDADIVRIAAATGIQLIASLKPSTYALVKDSLNGVHTLLMNFREAKEIAINNGCHSNDVAEIAKTLHKQHNATIVITRGKDGIYALDLNGVVYEESTKAREVYDVTGAGDIVLATYATGICAGLNIHDAIHLANQAAGIKVGKVGVATVTLDELRNATAGNK